MSQLNDFGLPVEPEEAPVVEETAEPESITSESPQVEETPAEGAPAEEAAPEEGPAAEAPESEAPAEAPELAADELAESNEQERQAAIQAWVESMPEGVQFAGKFTDPFQTEKAYNESRDMWRRANEARKAEAQEKLLLQEQYAQLYQRMEDVVPVLQKAAAREAAFQQFAEQYKTQYGDYPEGYQPPAPRPAPGPQDVQAIVDQRLAQERAAMQAAYQKQLEDQALATSVQGLYESHPELDPANDAQSHQIYDTIVELNESWDRYGIEVDPADQGTLEIAYEAARNPALLEVLKLNPSYFESAYGMELARRDAAVISGKVPATTAPQTRQVPASQVKTSGERKPFSESAAVGASAPETEDESDPWVRIKNAGSNTPGGGGSVFFE